MFKYEVAKRRSFIAREADKEMTQLSAVSMSSSVTRLGDLLDCGQALKPLAGINLPKSPTFVGNFCNGVKVYHFSSEIIFGQLLQTFGNFFLVTLMSNLSIENNHLLRKGRYHCKTDLI